MKKIILGILTAIIIPVTVFSASPPKKVISNVQDIGGTFQKGTQILSLGLGLGNTFYGGGYSTRIPALRAGYEIGVSDKVGIGYIGVEPFIGYAASRYQYANYNGNVYGYDYSYLTIACRGNYHMYTQNNWDLYAGIMLGYTIVNYSTYGNNFPGNNYSANGSFLASGIYGGARYYVNNNMGLFAELGFGYTALTLGINFGLN